MTSQSAPVPSSVDVAVVGSGLAGLTSASFLARAGRSVAVLESRGRVGGRATTDDRNGFHYNQGPHALYTGSVGLPILRSLGIEPSGASPGTRAGAVLNGRVARAATGVGSLLTTKLLPPRGRIDLAKVFTRLPRTQPDRWNHRTVNEWVHHVTDREDVAKILLGTVRLATYAHAADEMSAGAAITQLQLALRGVLYLHDGWDRQLVGPLATDATLRGVRIMEHARVVEAASDVASWNVITESGVTLRARAVVFAGLAPSSVEELLRLGVGALAHSGPSLSAAVLDLSLRTAPEHQVLLNFDEPLYFSVHGPVARLCPVGSYATVALRYLAVGEAPDPTRDRAALCVHARHAGATDVIDERFLMQMTVAHGLPLARSGGLGGRPGVRVRERPGAFLAGDWVGDAGQLADASISSGRAAAEAADEYLQ